MACRLARADARRRPLIIAGARSGSRPSGRRVQDRGAFLIAAESATGGEARFVRGSIFGHIAVMTGTASVGLMSLFLVDLADMYFISLLGETELAAAIGYAGSILFFTTSICIGIAIATAALVARAIGAGQRERARAVVASATAFALLVTLPLTALVWWAVPAALDLLGAAGRAHELATGYLRIIVPSMPVLVLAISAGGVLRAVGDPRRAMYTTLTGGAVNAALDPVLIFTLELGVDGAAIASVLARVAVLLVGLHGVVRVHAMLGRFAWRDLRRDLRPIGAIAVPAMLTNVATPIGNAYVTASIAAFGDGAVAGYAIVGRVMPVAFGAIFALSGAIGPIIGQNVGARAFARVRRTLIDGLLFSCAIVATVAILLYLAQPGIKQAFGVSGAAAELVGFFCTFVAGSFAFMGALFVANAGFNNLGKPFWSTLSNWARATLGTVPFVWLGGLWFGAEGVLAGQALGGVVFGTIAMVAALRLVAEIEAAGGEIAADVKLAQLFRVPLSAHTAYRGWTGLFSRQ